MKKRTFKTILAVLAALCILVTSSGISTATFASEAGSAAPAQAVQESVKPAASTPAQPAAPTQQKSAVTESKPAESNTASAGTSAKAATQEKKSETGSSSAAASKSGSSAVSTSSSTGSSSGSSSSAASASTGKSGKSAEASPSASTKSEAGKSGASAKTSASTAETSGKSGTSAIAATTAAAAATTEDVEDDGKECTCTVTADGYTVSVSFAKKDLPEEVDPDTLVLSVSRRSSYKRVDEGIEPIKKTTITLPTFVISLKDANGKAVSLKEDKTFEVTVKAPTSILPKNVDLSTIELLGGPKKLIGAPTIVASAKESIQDASLSATGGMITSVFQTTALAAVYGFDFLYKSVAPAISSASRVSGVAVRRAAAKAPLKAASDPEDVQPTVNKEVTPNGDGTYKITLSVTGKASSTEDSTKADVIVVYDKSTSMMYPDGNIQRNDNGPYGREWYGNRAIIFPLYTHSYDENWNDVYTLVGTNSTSWNEQLYHYNNNGYTAYNGDRYSGTSRAVAAKSAVDTLAKNVLNDSGDVTFSIVTFGKNSSLDIDHATTYSGAKSAIDSLDRISKNQGTNWEAGLDKALTAVNGGTPGATKYVIFVSDGEPTYSMSDGNGTSYNAAYYNAAKTKAQAIVNIIGASNFFTVSAYDTSGRMKQLVTDVGGNPSTNYFEASNSASLAAAFDAITQAITKAMEIRNVTLSDTVTSLSSVGAAVAAGSEVGKFTYSKSNASDWTPANQATVKDGKVSWKPVKDGESLESGVTYSVSFNVWPSQAAYDLAAALTNGTKTYDSLTDEQKAQITKNADGTYSLKTNSTATDENGKSVNQVTYSKVKTDSTTDAVKALTDEQKATIKAGNGKDVKVGDNTFRYNATKDTYEEVTETAGTAELDGNGTMPLKVAKVTVKKQWLDADGKDISDKLGESASAAFEVKSDDGTTVRTLTLNSGNSWTGTAYLAPGLKVNGEELDQGHTYTISESSSNSGNDLKFDFEGGTLEKPMLVNSPDTFENGTGEQEFAGKNRLKTTDLTIRKILVGKYVDPTTSFTVKVSAGDDWKSILAGNSYPYTITQADVKSYQKDDSSVNDAQPLPSTTSGTLTFDENGQAVDAATKKPLVIKSGWEIKVSKLPVGAKVTVAEDTASLPEKAYTVKYNGEAADSCAVTLAEKSGVSAVTITNNSNVKVPDTGVSTTTSAGPVGILVSAAVAVMVLLAAGYGWRRFHR